MTAFDVLDRSTWPDLLTLDEVALILRRKPGGLRKPIQHKTLQPAPAFTGPYRWRKTDVVAHLDGAPQKLRRAS